MGSAKYYLKHFIGGGVDVTLWGETTTKERLMAELCEVSASYFLLQSMAASTYFSEAVI